MSAPEKTYWDIVRGQFRKHRTAVWGLRIVMGLFLLAICTPMIATSSPYAIKTGEDGVWDYPWFRDLLDQNVFPSGVDLFFNLALVFLPLAIAVWFLAGKVRRTAMFWTGIVFLYCFAMIVLPKPVVESGIGRVVFFAQGALRQSRKKINYQDARKATLELVLTEQRVALYEKKVVVTRDALAATEARLEGGELDAPERVNLEAERGAQVEDFRNAERSLSIWQRRRTAAEEFASKPENKVVAVMPPVGYHHDDNDKERVTEKPTFSGWGVAHFLGTDRNGRDVMARILYGTRVSLTIGVIAVAIYCTIGTILGSLMGYFGGWVDILLMRFVEIMICFPSLAFILIIVAVTESQSIFLIMLAIGLISWTGVARLIRGQFLQERSQDYVTAAYALGIPVRKIVFKHVLPNAIHPMFVAATFGVAAAILAESSLAFLGLGDPKVPSWGQILLQGQNTGKLWLIFSPGVAIFLTVTVLNLVGEGLRDALDPKLRQ